MNAQAQTANPYLRTKVMTAGPMELRLMLYDGAIKFCRQARHALAHRDYEGSYNGLIRAQKIMLELSSSLKPEIDPQLCERMAALYNYLYRRLVDANMERDPAIVDECIELIEYERETWQLLMKRANADDNPAATAADSRPQPDLANPLASIGPAAAGATAEGASSFSAEG